MEKVTAEFKVDKEGKDMEAKSFMNKSINCPKREENSGTIGNPYIESELSPDVGLSKNFHKKPQIPKFNNNYARIQNKNTDMVSYKAKVKQQANREEEIRKYFQANINSALDT